MPPGLDVLVPELREQFEQRYKAAQTNSRSNYAALFPKERAMEIGFLRAGGLLVAGTDPTGGGGVIPGYSDQRADRAARRGRAHAARGDQGRHAERRDLPRPRRRDRLDRRRQAGRPRRDRRRSRRRTSETFERSSLVFKQGVGYDPAKLIASVKGQSRAVLRRKRNGLGEVPSPFVQTWSERLRTRPCRAASRCQSGRRSAGPAVQR